VCVATIMACTLLQVSTTDKLLSAFILSLCRAMTLSTTKLLKPPHGKGSHGSSSSSSLSASLSAPGAAEGTANGTPRQLAEEGRADGSSSSSSQAQAIHRIQLESSEV